MKSNKILVCYIFLLLLVVGCEKESVRIDDYWVEFATVNKTGNNIAFHLDNGKILTPQNPTSLDLEEGSRVIVNYSFIENETIKVNSVRRIFMDSIKEKGYPEEVKKDPVKIKSVWVSGNYLNMSFEVDYHSKPHKTGLYRNMNASNQTLYFSYSRQDDPPGAPTLMYVSFNITSLQDKNFTVYINTYEGEREFLFAKD